MIGWILAAVLGTFLAVAVRHIVQLNRATLRMARRRDIAARLVERERNGRR